MIEAVIKEEIEKAWEYIKSRYNFLDKYELILVDQNNIDEQGNDKDFLERPYNLEQYEGRTLELKQKITLRCDVRGDEFDNSKKIILIVNLFHEVGHANIFKYINDKEYLDAFYLANSFLAKNTFAFYFHENYKNYKKNPCEVVAQYIGINEAYTYFSSLECEENAERYICNYINWRIEKGAEFIGCSKHKNKHFKSFNSIKKAFEKKFIRSIYQRRAFDKNIIMDTWNSYVIAQKNNKNTDAFDPNIIRFAGESIEKNGKEGLVNHLWKIEFTINGAIQDLYISNINRDLNISDFDVVYPYKIINCCILFSYKLSLVKLYERIKKLKK